MRILPPSSRPTGGSDREAGAAMVIAVMVVAAIGVLGTSIAVQASYGTRSSGGSALASNVKDLADAGLAQGVTRLRDFGTVDVNTAPTVTDPAQACLTPTPAASNPTWTRGSAATVGAGSGQAVVWVEPIVKTTGAAAGSYRVCSRASSGTGLRTVSVNAVYTPGTSLSPFAVYSTGMQDIEGDAHISNISTYSESCIDRKGNKAQIVGTDKASGLPAAAHARLWVLDGNGKNNSCQSSGSVHAGGDSVDSDFPYDTDQAGGPVAGDVHSVGKPQLLLPPWSGSSLEPTAQTSAEFKAKWGVADMLGDTIMTSLENLARRQGNYYYAPPASLNNVSVPDETNAVVFVDFAVKATVNLKSEAFLAPFKRDVNPATCPSRSLVLVVRGADVKLDGTESLAVTLVIKNGDLRQSSGNNTIIGGVFADNIDMTGSASFRLDDCAAANVPPLGNDRVDVIDYREHDRT